MTSIRYNSLNAHTTNEIIFFTIFGHPRYGLTTHSKCVILFSFSNTITVRLRSPVLHLYHFLYCIFSHFLCSEPKNIPQRFMYMFLNLMAWNENNSKMQLCIPLLCCSFSIVHMAKLLNCNTIISQFRIQSTNRFNLKTAVPGTLTNWICGFSLYLWYFINILNTLFTCCNVECIYSLEPNKLQIIHLNYELAEYQCP